jgi:hypothetical protein
MSKQKVIVLAVRDQGLTVTAAAHATESAAAGSTNCSDAKQKGASTPSRPGPNAR